MVSYIFSAVALSSSGATAPSYRLPSSRKIRSVGIFNASPAVNSAVCTVVMVALFGLVIGCLLFVIRVRHVVGTAGEALPRRAGTHFHWYLLSQILSIAALPRSPFCAVYCPAPVCSVYYRRQLYLYVNCIATKATYYHRVRPQRLSA